MPKNSPIDSSTFGPIFGPLVGAAPLNELGAGHPDANAEKTIREISVSKAFAPHRIVDQSMADACLAGLWLMYDHLDESHTISQSIDTPTGSYWHAIMHRREGDFDNAKYWFRRVGTHPVFMPLAAAARELAGESAAGADRIVKLLTDADAWDPYLFVDLCAAAVRGASPAAQLCRSVQQRECLLLFDFCFRRAVDLP
jgi:hypothetical protein